MLAVFVCLVGILAVVLTAELLWRQKILRGEHQRKFVHISSAAFIASWPWLISFKTIQLLGAAMIVVLLLNWRLKKLHYLGDTRHDDYGVGLFAASFIV